MEITRILVVEDDPLITEVLVDYLKMAFTSEIEVATTGKDAIEVLKFKYFDFVISDFNLPLGSGFEVYDFVKSMTINAPFFILHTTDSSISSAVNKLKIPIVEKLQLKEIEELILTQKQQRQF